MGLFNNNQNVQGSGQRQMLENKYNAARHNLLLVVIFTVINVIMLVANANSYFLFSSFIPYFLVDLGMYLCGKYPIEYYSDVAEAGELVFFDNALFVFTLVFAFIIVALYLLCWIFSNKNRVGWMIFALVLFAIDTVGMIALAGISVDYIIDYLFHGWVIYYLISGIITYNKLKKLPADEPEVAAEAAAEPVVFINGEPQQDDKMN